MPKVESEEARLARLRRYYELKRDYAFLFYKPYPKQLDFHAAGAKYRERLLMAGNQTGKTFCAGNEAAFHATGLYPEWWQGYRCKRHNRAWVAGLTSEMTRDGAQRILLGPSGNWGTGTIPKECIVEIKRARGVPDAVETVIIRHIPTKEVSQMTFKAYADGREAFQSETLDWLWLDEEPPESIYTEGITRTNTTGGPVFLTFTPLLGMSKVVSRFLDHTDHPDRCMIGMTIDECEHYTEERRAQIISQYPEHEREARAMGIPMLGEGRVFPIAEEMLREEPLAAIPSHWRQIIGIDLGWDHPTAAAHLLYDPDTDTIHIHAVYRMQKEIPLVHADAIKRWGPWVPVAWPRDANQTDKGSGEQLASIYRGHGLAMLSEPASFPDKRKNSVEDGIMEMLERMRTNRFKVSKNCWQWWEEFRMYHRLDGKIVKQREDTICASRYAMMMLRFAMPGAYAPAARDKYARSRGSDGTWMSA